MNDQLQRNRNFRRLMMLADDFEQVILNHLGDLNHQDSYLLFDLRSRMVGIATILLEDNLHQAVDEEVQVAAREYHRILQELEV